MLRARHARADGQGLLLMSVTIWHNPACGTSRNTLALIRATGTEPEVVLYLETPPSRAELVDAIERLRIGPRALLREKGTPFGELGLSNPALTGDDLIDAMVEHPILINRPVVFGPNGAKLCRPSEEVLSILDRPLTEDFVKEDGEMVPVNV